MKHDFQLGLTSTSKQAITNARLAVNGYVRSHQKSLTLIYKKTSLNFGPKTHSN